MTEVYTNETKNNGYFKLPSISIIMVSYNQGSKIEQAILSVINQNYPNLEFIIIDGGSTDDTIEIIGKYKAYIKILISEPDKGMYHARNKGIFLCTGDYVGFLNTDDVFYPNALREIGMSILEKNNAEMIFGYTIGINRNGQELARVLFGQDIDTSKTNYFNSMKTIPDQSTFYKRSVFSIIGIYDTSLRFGADTDLKCRIIKNELSIIVLEKIIAGWRIYEDALTFRPDLKYVRFIEAIKINYRYSNRIFNYYTLRLLYYTFLLPPIKRLLKYQEKIS